MALPYDTGRIDSHECQLELRHDGVAPDEIDDDTEFICRVCGTVTTPAVGVTNAKRSRLW